MICIHCNRDCKLKERPDGLCPHCRWGFAFEPQRGGKVTDLAFKNAMDRVSSDGKVAWGAEHLRHALRRRRDFPKGPLVILAAVLIFGGAAVWVNWRAPVGIKVLAVLAVVALYALVVAFARGRRLSISESEFREMLDRWTAVHGRPRGLIVRAPTATKLKGAEPDLLDYSFDRAVICDRARTVDLLVANNFHSENNCAVLASTGYPKRIFASVKTMLMRNPRLKVFVLHDATVAGCTLAHHLANSSEWFKDRALVIDVGLRPEHAGGLERLYEGGAGTVLPTEGIEATEGAWLARQSVELAVLMPEQVIKRLFRALSKEIDPSNSAEYRSVGGVLVDRTSFRTAASASDGGSDSFG